MFDSFWSEISEAPKLSTWLFQKSQGRLHPCEKLMLLLLPLLLLLLFEFPAGAAIVQILLAAQASVGVLALAMLSVMRREQCGGQAL